MQPGRMRILQIGSTFLKNIPFMLADLLPGEERYGDAVLPTSLFDAVYFSSSQNYVVLNPILR